ncbi:hypothetical protein OJF2_58300 [Aquisphaera giovannonii]|uniref:Uncharacterized protein n=1 Tax=Aquisphaera giovannonii TaxID=406548 RepID=A0A5B9W9L1_9BACT|nr:radical SAM protein [Aquisphaera giovannonii]QEH37243.1 hypothetical protein OJF2_58300 [Aquisphaera giovannonii]
MTHPDPQTEAACLLHGGALYRSRVGLAGSLSAGLVFAGFKKGAFSLYFDDAPIFHFDLEGRWQRAFVDHTHYLKGLDASIQAVDRVREGANMVLRRRRLDDADGQVLDRLILDAARGLLEDLREGRLRPEAPPEGKAIPLQPDELTAFLERIVSWDESAWRHHRDRYEATYGPLPLIPPDCQHAVVVQATIGKGPGSIFGRDGWATRVRTAEEFREHVEAVAGLLGGRLQQSRIAFLGGSEAIRQEPRQVESYLDAAGSVLAIGRREGNAGDGEEGRAGLEGIHAFVDRFEPPRPALDSLRSYRRRHVTAIGLGIASGDPVVRDRLGVRWTDEDLRPFVDDLRAAGIRISFLTLSDAGGPDRSREHVAATAELLGSLQPSRSENVFLVDAADVLEPELAARCAPAGGGDTQGRQALRDALAPLRGGGAKVLAYTPEKHWA